MNVLALISKNILNPNILSFFAGYVLQKISFGVRIPQKLHRCLTLYILFMIGLKGGGPLIEHLNATSSTLLVALGILIIWGTVQPIFSFIVLKKCTSIDVPTAAAIAASFGSVSVMTFVSAVAFLESLQTSYQNFFIVALAVMETPAIISSLCIAKSFQSSVDAQKSTFIKILRESLMNPAILTLFLGLISGGWAAIMDLRNMTEPLIEVFTPLLCLFLFDMGVSVSLYRQTSYVCSWSLTMFGIYMPLIGSVFGLVLSYTLGLDVGSGTLVAVLSASASYIAVPAAMRVALPEAKEGVYLPLSLGIAFPFNIMFGIPIYYYWASKLLK